MNVLDAVLFVAAVAVFSAVFRYGAICTAIVFLATITGFVAGVSLLPVIASPGLSNMEAGFLGLFLIVGPAVFCGALAWWAAQRLHVKLLLAPWYKADQLVGWPVKMVGLFAGAVLLTHTLPFVPIVPFQYQAQGSTFLLGAYRIGPALPALSHKVQALREDQFDTPIVLDKQAAVQRLRSDQRQFFTPLVQSSVRVVGPVCLSGTGMSGSGAVVEGGYIVTNAHVVRHLREVYVETETGSYPATPLAIDDKNDLAVLYTRYLDTSHMTQLHLRSTDTAAGSAVHVFGYPGGGGLSIDTNLTVREYSEQSNAQYGRGDSMIKTFRIPAGSTTHGSSGSPVVDLDGKVAGVLFAGNGEEAIVVPVSTLSPLLDAAKRAIKPVRTGC